MSRRLLLLITTIATCSILLSGCSAAVAPSEIEWRENSEQSLLWPQPPLPARIEFLRSLRGAKDFRTSEEEKSFVRWLFGDPELVIQLIRPAAVAADNKGRLWVADSSLNAVFRFDLGRKKVEYLFSVDGTPLGAPVGLAYDSISERLYVSDSVHGEVYVFDDEFNKVGGLLPPGGFGRPGGIDVHAGHVYVADVTRGLVEVFNPVGQHLRTIASKANENGRFRLPTYLAIGPNGEVAVTDALRFHVEVQSASGDLLATIGGLGDSPGNFARPRGVAFDTDANIYVADAAFDNIQVFDLTGKLLLFWGGAGENSGLFSLPAGLASDPENRIYVADSYNHRVQVFQYLSQD